jgi:hypothetical protein
MLRSWSTLGSVSARQVGSGRWAQRMTATKHDLARCTSVALRPASTAPLLSGKRVPCGYSHDGLPSPRSMRAHRLIRVRGPQAEPWADALAVSAAKGADVPLKVSDAAQPLR